MKHIATMFAVMFLVTASYGEDKSAVTHAYTNMIELAQKNGCTACHALDSKGIGPSWRDVAWKYAGKTTYEYAYKTYSLEEGLVRKASLGGRHDWGEPVMPSNDYGSLEQKGARQDEIRQLVRFILNLPLGKLPSTMAEFKAQGFEPGNGKAFRDCPRCPEMVMIPQGTLVARQAGSQKTQIFSEAFAVGKYEVTFNEWDACVADGGCNEYRPDDHDWGRGQQPVINVSWKEANKYVQWLTQKTGHSYRLLTAAEWVYAARAGTATAYPWGNGIGVAHANCDGCGSQWDGRQAAPVGSFQPNAFGLYDMNGNVSEMVEDCINANCDIHYTCGGSWYRKPSKARSLCFGSVQSGAREKDEGFRVARKLP